MLKSGLQDVQVDKAPVEAAVLEHDPESSIRPEDDDDDAGSQNSHVSPLPVASVTESQTPVSEDLSSTATVSPAPSACRSETCEAQQCLTLL